MVGRGSVRAAASSISRAIYVDRATKWGNPCKVRAGHQSAEEAVRSKITGQPRAESVVIPLYRLGG